MENQPTKEYIPVINNKKVNNQALSVAFGIITAIGASALSASVTWFFTSKTQIQLINQKIKYQDLVIQDIKTDIKSIKSKLNKIKESEVQNHYVIDSTIQQLSQEIRVLNNKIDMLESYIKRK